MLIFLQELRKARFAAAAAGLQTQRRHVVHCADFAVLRAPRAAQTCAVGIVGGSDLSKISEQLGADGSYAASSAVRRARSVARF